MVQEFKIEDAGKVKFLMFDNTSFRERESTLFPSSDNYQKPM